MIERVRGAAAQMRRSGGRGRLALVIHRRTIPADQEPQTKPRADAVHQGRRGDHSGRARDARARHTVGHTIFMIDSGGKQLCYVGDLAHHPALLLQKPLTEFKYDTNPKQSAQSRAY
jgi:glyoxylase-like metal-dependent hydrolase (beta-lactamase superfamily II)